MHCTAPHLNVLYCTPLHFHKTSMW
jgi:hypothetical protein